MLTTSHERQQMKAQGIYIAERCDGCGKLLNQTFRYTIAEKPEVYCSAMCRDKVFGERFAKAEHEKSARRATERRACLFVVDDHSSVDPPPRRLECSGAFQPELAAFFQNGVALSLDVGGFEKRANGGSKFQFWRRRRCCWRGRGWRRLYLRRYARRGSGRPRNLLAVAQFLADGFGLGGFFLFGLELLKDGGDGGFAVADGGRGGPCDSRFRSDGPLFLPKSSSRTQRTLVDAKSSPLHFTP
jgi:hypothetical protein